MGDYSYYRSTPIYKLRKLSASMTEMIIFAKKLDYPIPHGILDDYRYIVDEIINQMETNGEQNE